MNKAEWRLFRVRPANHPRRRIMGAASILDRFLEPGLAVGLREVVRGLSPAKLTEALFAAGMAGPAFVGSGRAKDLAVNAVLPFMRGWAETDGQGPGQDPYRKPLQPVSAFDGQRTDPGDDGASAARRLAWHRRQRPASAGVIARIGPPERGPLT